MTLLPPEREVEATWLLVNTGPAKRNGICASCGHKIRFGDMRRMWRRMTDRHVAYTCDDDDCDLD